MQDDNARPEIDASTNDISTDWQPILGPFDRTSFFEEQARHRRATWQVTALCIVAIVVTAIPFSAIVGPLVYGAVAVSIRLMGLVSPVPDQVWVPFRLAWQLMSNLIDSLDYLKPGDAFGVAGTILILLSPGILGIVATWLWLRMVLTSDGVGGVLLQLGAREPRIGDLEEQQLVNVVQEMAIAAGLPPPHVLLIDAPVANAAAIGTGPMDAKVIVTRRLLDELDRDETQGVLGHLIGSIGNGDLRIGVLILSVFQTLGFLATVLDLPISGHARGSMFRFIKALLPGGVTRDQSSSVIAASLLAESMADKRMNEINLILDAPEAQGLNPFWKGVLMVRRIVLIPWLLLSLFGKMVLTVIGSLLMGQTIAWAWRTRRFLADATAVQLTRNPTGLGRALEALAQRGGLIPGGQWATHLFIVGGEVIQERAMADRVRRMTELRDKLKNQPAAERIRATFEAAKGMPAEQAALDASTQTATLGGETLSMGDMHPSLGKRLTRLAAQGAYLDRDGGSGAPLASGWNRGLATVIIVPLMILVGGLMSVVIGLMTMLAFLAFEIGMGLVIMLLVPGINK
ncbi:MAG: M48 family metalloprotease [Chloroflexota bacterium]